MPEAIHTTDVHPPTPQVELSASHRTTTAGRAVTFTARVRPHGTTTPRGSVTFLADGDTESATFLGSVALDATGSASVTKDAWPGTFAVFAVYAGEADTPSVRSPTVAVRVTTRTPECA